MPGSAARGLAAAHHPCHVRSPGPGPITVSLAWPHPDAGGRLPLFEVAEAIDRSPVAGVVAAPAAPRRPRFVDLDPAWGLAPTSARLDRLVRAILAESRAWNPRTLRGPRRRRRGGTTRWPRRVGSTRRSLTSSPGSAGGSGRTSLARSRPSAGWPGRSPGHPMRSTPLCSGGWPTSWRRIVRGPSGHPLQHRRGVGAPRTPPAVALGTRRRVARPRPSSKGLAGPTRPRRRPERRGVFRRGRHRRGCPGDPGLAAGLNARGTGLSRGDDQARRLWLELESELGRRCEQIDGIVAIAEHCRSLSVTERTVLQTSRQSIDAVAPDHFAPETSSTSPPPGDHAVLLDGSSGSFLLTFGPTEDRRDANVLLSWAWSINVLPGAFPVARDRKGRGHL